MIQQSLKFPMGKLTGDKVSYSILHFFCGLGAAALGFQRSLTWHRGLRGAFRTVAGIDVDRESCEDFENLTGAPAHQEDIATMRARTLRQICPESPDMVFLSPPCKGFSGLLPKKVAKQAKYQKLNELVPQGLALALRTWEKPPGLILLENVPRITARGAHLLLEVKQLLQWGGYLLHDGYHDCGELGGLAQHRKRYLLIARQPDRLPAFVYKPPKRRVRAIGEVLEQLPMPDDPCAGRMHRLSRLQWLTWLRLALIPAGGDWRDLPSEVYQCSGDPTKYAGRPGLMGVTLWDRPSRSVTGTAAVSSGNGAAAVQDMRVDRARKPMNNVWKVVRWDQTPGAVTAGSGPSSSGTCVGDPRLGYEPRRGSYKIVPFDAPCPTITSAAGIGRSQAFGVSDPRLPEKDNRYHNQYKVLAYDAPANTVTGSDRVGSGAPAVADKRVPRQGYMGVTPWDKPSRTVTGAARTTKSNGQSAVADPRLPPRAGRFKGKMRISPWDKPARTVTGGADLGANAASVADPRLQHKLWSGTLRVVPWEDPAPTVIAGTSKKQGGGFTVADPRLGCSPRAGSYGVVPWDDPISTVIGSADVHAGKAAAADPRIPDDRERPDPPPVIVSEDGTWHRPLTTLELAALQGLPMTMEDGSPLQLAGKADKRWRERIGNAVPVPTAQAIGEAILASLLQHQPGDVQEDREIWVRRRARKEVPCA